jgi:hypothetical protein
VEDGTGSGASIFLSASLTQSDFGTLPWANAMRSQRDGEAKAA